MRIFAVAAGVLVGFGPSFAAADPTHLLAPDDPAYASGWRPPPSPVGDLKTYRPVEAKGWIDGGAARPASQAIPPMPEMHGDGAGAKPMPDMGSGR